MSFFRPRDALIPSVIVILVLNEVYSIFQVRRCFSPPQQIVPGTIAKKLIA
jgi:hypothetical protein